jgi:hypothetical protein
MISEQDDNTLLSDNYLITGENPMPKSAAQIYVENFWWGRGFCAGFVAGALVVLIVGGAIMVLVR